MTLANLEHDFNQALHERVIAIAATCDVVRKWYQVAYEKRINRGAQDCALCQQYLAINTDRWPIPADEQQSGLCVGCPVAVHTGKAGCNGTPYHDYVNATHPVLTALYARKELHFLWEVLQAQLPRYWQVVTSARDDLNELGCGKCCETLHRGYIAVQAALAAVEQAYRVLHYKAQIPKVADIVLCRQYRFVNDPCNECPVFRATDLPLCQNVRQDPKFELQRFWQGAQLAVHELEDITCGAVRRVKLALSQRTEDDNTSQADRFKSGAK